MQEELEQAIQELLRLATYVSQAKSLVDSSTHKEHLYHVAGAIIEEAPEALSNALQILMSMQDSSPPGKRKAYNKPVEEMSGYRTVVRQDDDVSEGKSDVDRTPDSALPLGERRKNKVPLPSGGGEKGEVRRVQFNSPGPEADLPQVKSQEPGEQYGHPYKDTPLLTRRTMKAAQRRAVRKKMKEIFG